MRLRKFIVGILFFTVFTCGYAPQGYSFQLQTPQRIEVVERAVKEELSERKLERKGQSGSTLAIYTFLIKVDFRFYSSPPRASP